MKWNFLIIPTVCLYAVATPSFAMSEAECEVKWKTVDANGDGTISEADGAQIYTTLSAKKIAIEPNKLDRKTYIEHCRSGALKNAELTPGAPLKGANSFTEAQARERALANGLKDVSALTKDQDGIWRGTASDGAKTVNVAVDFRGNVVVN